MEKMKTEKNYKILHSEEITKDDIKSLCALEKKYYNLPVEQQFSVRKTAALHKLNNDDLVILKDEDNNQVVGFISMIPIRWNCYKKIRSGKYYDTIININNVKTYDKPGFYNIYVSSVIIDKEKHSYGALKFLLDGIYRKIWKLAIFKGIVIKNILADAITVNGAKLCKSMGFKKIRESSHGSSIYEFEMIPNKNYEKLFSHSDSFSKLLDETYERKVKESKIAYKVKSRLGRHGNGIGRWLKYIIKVRPANKRLIKEFPFLRYHPECTEGFAAVPYFKKHPYRKTFLDEMPDGWRKAFGIQMCKDIKNCILEYDRANGTDFLHEYGLSQIKEKWGSLCWYDNGAPEGVYSKIEKIISYYEDLSMATCIICGKTPTKYKTLGWINYICEDCKEHALKDPKDAVPITWDDIPYRRHYDAETDTFIDIESKIKFKEIWQKPEEE